MVEVSGMVYSMGGGWGGLWVGKKNEFFVDKDM